MKTLIANLAGKVRRDILGGREHLVAPVTMIVPGVLNGSRGPILYTAEENKKSVELWNGMPITINHPTKPVSARSKEILNSQGVGIVLSSRIENGELKAEGWFDIERLSKVDKRVLNSLLNNEKIELSTGLDMDRQIADESDNTFNGERYDSIARNYRPDHLAILPDVKGACSLTDGCGVLNKDKEDEIESVSDTEDLSVATSTTNSREDSKMCDGKLKRDEVVNGLITNCACWTEDDRETLNALSDDQLTRIAKDAVKASKHDSVQETLNSLNGKEVTVGDEVFAFNSESTEFEKVSSNESEDEKDTTMNDAGQGMADQPLTADQWFAAAPPEVKQTIEFAQKIQNSRREELVTKIVENADEGQQENLTKVYNAMPLDQLEVVANSIPEKKIEAPKPKFIGHGADPAQTQNASKSSGPLEIPTMQFN